MVSASQRNSDNPTVDLLGRGGGRKERRQWDLDASFGAAFAELGSLFSATKCCKGHIEIIVTTTGIIILLLATMVDAQQ